MQSIISGDAYGDAGARNDRAIVLCEKLLHFAHALISAQDVKKSAMRGEQDVRIVAGRPKKIKVVIQGLLHVDLAALVPSPRLRFTGV